MRLSTKGSRANLSNGIDRRSAAQRRLSLSPGSSSGHTNSNFRFRRGRFVWVRFLQLREQIRPGTTGLWQVTVRRDNDLVLQQSLILAIWRSVQGQAGGLPEPVPARPFAGRAVPCLWPRSGAGCLQPRGAGARVTGAPTAASDMQPAAPVRRAGFAGQTRLRSSRPPAETPRAVAAHAQN